MIVLPPIGPDLRERFAYLRLRADVLRCCGIVDNLRIVEYDNRNMRAVCVKCYRKHRIVTAEPGHFGAERREQRSVRRDYRMRAEPGAMRSNLRSVKR